MSSQPISYKNYDCTNLSDDEMCKLLVDDFLLAEGNCTEFTVPNNILTVKMLQYYILINHREIFHTIEVSNKSENVIKLKKCY